MLASDSITIAIVAVQLIFFANPSGSVFC